MKPFDLEAAKRGEPIITRAGQRMKFITYVPDADPSFRVVCMYESGVISEWGEDGRISSIGDQHGDLIMAPKKRKVEGWVNVYSNSPEKFYGHESHDLADLAADGKRIGGRAHFVTFEIEE